MSTTCRTCEVAPLDCGTAITTYSLQEDTYFYETHCPPGSVCNALDEMLMECCDGVVLRVVFPTDATAALRDAIMQALLAEYWKRQALCRTEGTADDPVDGDPTDPDDPLQLYFNKYTKCTSYCSDGLPFTYIVLPGKFVAATQEEADAAALSWACSQAKTHKICLSALKNSVGEVVTTGAVGTAFAAKITATGAYLSDISNTWLLVSGTLPPGITFPGDVGSKSLPFVGTPTAGGDYTFTIGIRAPNGDYMTKPYTLTIAGENFYAYWKCEENAAPIVDSTGNTNLILDSGVLSRVAGKVAYGYSMNGVTLQTASTNRFQFSGDFTIRFWYYDNHTAAGATLMVNDDAGDESFSIELNLAPGSNGPNWVVWDAGNNDHVLNASGGLELAAGWHRIIVWYEDGVGMGMKIDNSASATLAQAAGIYATAGDELVVTSPALGSLAGYKIDEIAVWDRLLTSAEMLADWNSGNGTTYPTI